MEQEAGSGEQSKDKKRFTTEAQRTQRSQRSLGPQPKEKKRFTTWGDMVRKGSRKQGILTAASQTIGRELEALPIFQGANREPDRSEGSDRTPNWALTKAPSQGALTKDRARTRSVKRPSTVSSANPKRCEGSGRELGTHKRRPHKTSDAELEAFNVGPQR